MMRLEKLISDSLNARHLPQEETCNQSLEFRGLCQAFAHLDLDPEKIEQLPHDLASLLLKKEMLVVSTQQLPQIASEIARSVLPYIHQADSQDPRILSMASIQIATSLLSHMKADPKEFCSDIATENVCKSWGTPGGEFCHDEIPSRFDGILSAFRRRDGGDPAWSHAWLRSDHAPFEEDGSCQTENYRAWLRFETFWKAQAWREEGMHERALSCLTQQRAYGEAHPCLGLLMAEILIDLGQFGRAEHEILELESNFPEIFDSKGRKYKLNRNLWNDIVSQTRYRLSQAALKKALSSHDINDGLLQLAMNTGDDSVVCEAALCWFDAGIEPVDVLIDCLKNNIHARNLWIKNIVGRNEVSNVDKLYDLFIKLDQALPNTPEIQLLNVMSQLDSISSASQTLEKCLGQMSMKSDLYRNALELWVDIQCTQNAYDEALRGIIPALIAGEPHADQLLRFLMTTAPREALQMLQTVLIEQAGLEATRTIFERLRKNSVLEKEGISLVHNYPIDEISVLILPVPYQIEYHTQHMIPHEDSAKAARRASVLEARGIVSKKFDSPPEPAEWIHTAQPKASDSF